MLKKRNIKESDFMEWNYYYFNVGVLTFVLPTLSNAAAGNITFAGDSRGGVQELLDKSFP